MHIYIYIYIYIYISLRICQVRIRAKGEASFFFVCLVLWFTVVVVVKYIRLGKYGKRRIALVSCRMYLLVPSLFQKESFTLKTLWEEAGKADDKHNSTRATHSLNYVLHSMEKDQNTTIQTLTHISAIYKYVIYELYSVNNVEWDTLTFMGTAQKKTRYHKPEI
eukprot:gene12386-8511_t